jgi:hypothetical protein
MRFTRPRFGSYLQDIDALYQIRVHQLFIGCGCAVPDLGSAVIYKIWMRFTKPGISNYLEDMDALYQTRVQKFLKRYDCASPDPDSIYLYDMDAF